MIFPALSISRSVRERLEHPPFEVRILAVFDRACDLVTTDGNVIALVTPDIGDGPLNIVVDAEPGDFASLVDATIVVCHSEPRSGEESHPFTTETLRFAQGDTELAQVALKKAKLWEPRPDWNVLCNNLAIVTRRLPTLREIALRHTTVEAILAAAPPGRPQESPLQTGWNGDLVQLRQAARQLAGLGGGLTPAGDDFLCGVMLWAWLAHPTPQKFCRIIAETSAPRTTTLSAAFLRSAAQGECSAAWHQLLNALASGSHDELDAATVKVLAHGATSGADALAGFLALAS